MPELPDVQVFKQYVDSTSLHQTIRKIDLRSPELLGDVSAEELKQHLLDHSIHASRRHGKYLFLRLDNSASVVLHFGMTGFPVYFLNQESAPDHIRLLLTFSSGYYLAYDCRRKLGLIDLAGNEQDFIDSKELGIDAFSEHFTYKTLKDLLKNKKGSIKSTLMNQKIIAGIGNIYSDEILFQSGIHPKSCAGALDDSRLKHLYNEIKRVFQQSIQSLASTRAFPKEFLLPNREPGAECPLCGGNIVKQTISSRSSYFCNQHQTDIS
ncbi:MAG: DNA-formamidopyrimidine glycosylase family protein [candidate division KSB1 bacterium]|nr:DNA-formamidopyrimidine glycosylase family protein [candidate division KSB1 bacterium]